MSSGTRERLTPPASTPSEPVKAPSRRRAALTTLGGTGATVAITVAQAFILIPLCLTYLGSHLYGAWLGASELLIWLQLLDMGIPNVMTQRIGAAVGRNDEAAASAWASTGLWMLAAIGAGLAGLATVAAPAVAWWARVPAGESAAFASAFRIGAVASAMLLWYFAVLGISRGVQMTALVNVAQVTAALLALAVSAALLVAGFGIYALALGLLTRALVSVIGAVIFLAQLRRSTGLSLGRPSRAVRGEIFGLAPSMAGANAGYLLANNSEVLLVTTLFGPVTATVYALTRRAIDGFRSLLDSIAWAVYGGFAHLVTADDRHRARAVLHEVLWLRLAAACLCGAVVLTVNQAFVTLLFGSENFGGIWLTAGFAVQMILSGQAFLSNYLLRAAGQVREGSVLLAGEALVRVAAMVAGLAAFGLVGAPWAAAAVSAVLLVVMLRRLDRELPPSAMRSPERGIGSRLAPCAVLLLGGVLAFVGIPVTWTSVASFAALVTVIGLAAFWWMLPPEVGNGSLLRWNRT
jgi:O-antigen/teichoic acid export membrane protein